MGAFNAQNSNWIIPKNMVKIQYIISYYSKIKNNPFGITLQVNSPIELFLSSKFDSSMILQSVSTTKACLGFSVSFIQTMSNYFSRSANHIVWYQHNIVWSITKETFHSLECATTSSNPVHNNSKAIYIVVVPEMTARDA